MKTPKSCITRYFHQTGDISDFEIQTASKRLFGAVNLASGMFKLEHCSFNLTEAIDELKFVHAVACLVYDSKVNWGFKGGFSFMFIAPFDK